MRRRGTEREGMALLTVLLLVAVMSVVAVAILDDVRFSVRRTANVEFQSQAQWYAAGAESLAMGQIAGLLARGPARTPLQPAWNGRPVSFPIDGGTLTSDVTPDVRNWQFGAGIGIRYHSSFGPIRRLWQVLRSSAPN